MTKTDQIAFHLPKFVNSGRDILIPNYYWGHWEADLLKITPSGIVYEYEIKVSRADFKNDFSKGFELWNREKISKHDNLVNGNHKVHHFYYVVPENLIKLEEVPSMFGLIYFHKIAEFRCSFNIIRPAKRLIKGPISINYSKIAYKLSFRENNLRHKNRYLSRRMQEVYQKYNDNNDDYIVK